MGSVTSLATVSPSPNGLIRTAFFSRLLPAAQIAFYIVRAEGGRAEQVYEEDLVAMSGTYVNSQACGVCA